MTIEDRDDEAYWNALASRVAAAAIGSANRTAVDWLGRSPAAWIVTSLLAAVVSMFVLMADAPAAANSATGWVDEVAPADTMGKAIVLSERPPGVDALLLDKLDGANRSSR